MEGGNGKRQARGLLELPGEILGDIAKKLEFQDFTRFVLVSKKLKDKIRTERILYPFVVIHIEPELSTETPFLAAYSPASDNWTYKLTFSKCKYAKLIAIKGDFLCLKKWEDNKLLVLNIRTDVEYVVPSAPNHSTVEILDFVKGFKIVCFSQPEEGLVQSWIYDSSRNCWEFKADIKGVSLRYESHHRSGSLALWKSKIWAVSSTGIDLLAYDYLQGRFSVHSLNDLLPSWVNISFVVCCGNKLFVIGYLVPDVLVWEYSEAHSLKQVSSSKLALNPYGGPHGVCTDGIRRIWVLGGDGSLELDVYLRKWKWINSPPIMKTNCFWKPPLIPCYCNLQFPK